MKPVVFDLTGTHPLTAPLYEALSAEPGELEQRRFPDGESYLRVAGEVERRQTIIVADLSRPDERFLPLSFLAATLAELGATGVGLVAPYLCYMRQDRRFRPGEAVTAPLFARLLSSQVDWLVTVDPHLHRIGALEEIYSIPARTVHGATLLAQWLARQGESYLLVGPDSESEQWVAAISQQCGQPYVVGRKRRHGDRSVEIDLPDISEYRDRIAVVIDDIIASGHTLLRCIDALHERGFQSVDCVAVHGLFAEGSGELLRERTRRLVTTNSLPNAALAIDLTSVLISSIQYFLKTQYR